VTREEAMMDAIRHANWASTLSADDARAHAATAQAWASIAAALPVTTATSSARVVESAEEPTMVFDCAVAPSDCLRLVGDPEFVCISVYEGEEGAAVGLSPDDARALAACLVAMAEKIEVLGE
jgi:hypothetical protein